jgi:hypothetical protein
MLRPLFTSGSSWKLTDTQSRSGCAVATGFELCTFTIFQCLLSTAAFISTVTHHLHVTAHALGHIVCGRLTMTSYNNVKQLTRNPTADGSDLVLWLLLKVVVEEARFLEQPSGRLAASHSNMADGSECGGCCWWS